MTETTKTPMTHTPLSGNVKFSNKKININHNQQYSDYDAYNKTQQTTPRINKSGTVWIHDMDTSNNGNDEERRHKMHEDEDDEEIIDVNLDLYDNTYSDNNNTDYWKKQTKAKKSVTIAPNLNKMKQKNKKQRPQTARSPDDNKNNNNFDDRQRRSFTVTSDSRSNKSSRKNTNIDHNNKPLTDFRQILRKYQQNKDRDIDYKNYMDKNFDDDGHDWFLEQQAKNRVFKRRETYASYLQYKHLEKHKEDDDWDESMLTEKQRKKLENMTFEEQEKYKKKMAKKARLKKIKTTPNYVGMNKSKSATFGDDDNNDTTDHKVEFENTMQYLDDDDDDDEHDENAMVTNMMYQVSDSDDDNSEDEKYDNFVASDWNRLKEKAESTEHKRTGSSMNKNNKHRRIHSRDHTRQKSLFDAIGSVTEKLGIIQGDISQGSIYTPTLRAATPPPILTVDHPELKDDKHHRGQSTDHEMKTPSMTSQPRSTVKFAEHLDITNHPMTRRRSSLPENFVFSDTKRFTVNDPNSNV